MTKEEYKKNLIRMFDSIRDENKGDESCTGIRCIDCPFDGKTCNTGTIIFCAYEGIEIVEKWAKDHPIKTNAEKFKEVFGTEVNRDACAHADKLCKECEYLNDYRCDARNKFWNAEYKPIREVQRNERND